MDLIQSNGQPRYGRFTELPTAISVERCIYRTAYGKTLSGWRKKLRYKKFKFCSIQHEHFSIGVAMADIGWAGHGFIYIYDHQTGQAVEWRTSTLPGRNTVVDEQPLSSHSHFNCASFQIEMRHANDVRYIRVRQRGQEILNVRIFCAGTAPLSLSSPNGINGWTYTQKLTTLAVEGCFMGRQGRRIELNELSFAMLDDSCGFLRPETAWFWLSASFRDVQGNRIGLNLASGVNESFGNENGVWVNGVLYPVADVLFEQQDEQCWQIRSLDGQLTLSVQTGWCSQENLNLYVVGSRFSQWQASISGQIQVGGLEIIRPDRAHALLEQHYAKW
ncbi:DUF2804 domain-containing protein [Acinetobacter sp. WZC-1]|uniref:DUF2804 domain-containing protein n=1 Tax=Acinetobacter sp. WZC-1 TaxID=3459034 RepID=UPI00403E35A1